MPNQPVSKFRILIPIVAIIIAAFLILFILPDLFFGGRTHTFFNGGSEHLMEGGGEKRQRIVIGTEVGDLEFVDLDGNRVRLSEMEQEITLINFWASWCPPCLREMPSLVKLRDDLHDDGFEVLGITVEERPVEIAAAMRKRLGITFPLLQDPEGSLAELFDVHELPLTVIISRSGRILHLERGERDWNSKPIKNKIRAWLKE